MHENSINYHLINNKYILSQLPINLPSYTFSRKVPCTFLLHLSPPPLLQKEKEKRRKTFFHPFENHRINDVKVNRYIKRYTTNTAQHSASIKPDNRTNNRKGRGVHRYPSAMDGRAMVDPRETIFSWSFVSRDGWGKVSEANTRGARGAR